VSRLTRSFRLYGKKRGNRRTGSRELASAGEALFFAVLLAVGLLGLSVMSARMVLPHWDVNYNYVQSECIVEAGRLIAQDGSDRVRPSLRVRHVVDGQTYSAWAYDAHGVFSDDPEAQQRILDRFEIGGEYPCWYSPDDPEKIVLVRRSGWRLWLWLLIPISLVAVGGGGLALSVLRWRTSEERLAALTQRAATLDIFEHPLPHAHPPGVPRVDHQTNSPGTQLAYRLPPEGAPALRLIGAWTLCAVWNAIALAFLVLAAGNHLRGSPNWQLDVLALPAAGVGGWLVYWLFRQTRDAAAAGPTFVEISDHPLRPGQTYQLLVSHPVRAPLDLTVSLICEEEACYRQGTDVRVEILRVHQQPIHPEDPAAGEPESPIGRKCPLAIPADAMHSFKSAHNEIRWSLLVCGTQANRAIVHRTFPVVVFPPGAGDPVQ
jgi:hypothetical protein